MTPKACPYCGETRLHFIPGGYCVKILKAKLEEAQGELENERDTRRQDLGKATMVALFNASQRSLAEAGEEIKRLKAELANSWYDPRTQAPPEVETVQLIISGKVHIGYWHDQAEGDWETGYKHYRQWYYVQEGDDQFVGLDEEPEYWKPLSAAPGQLPETARRRYCLTCKHEPDWQGKQGKCRLTLAEFGDAEAVMMERFDNPSEVITAEGNRVMNCTGWEPKEPES